MKLFEGRKMRQFDLSCECGQTYCHHDRVVVKNPGDADLVSSDLIDSALHMPVIDLDVPCTLVQSSTPGHSHLFINKPMTWDQERELLEAFAKAGVVEWGFVDASRKRGFTSVRVPWKPKGVTP